LSKYEQILSKIAPIFHKFLRYRLYFNNDSRLIISYLDKFNFSFRSYYYATEVPIIKTPTYLLIINRYGITVSNIYNENVEYPYMRLHLEYKKGITIGVTFDEAIVDLIINNFIFESSKTNPYAKTFKDLFIALVGKDTYDAIRNNIK